MKIIFLLCLNFDLFAQTITSRQEVENSEEFQKWVAFKKTHGKNYDIEDDKLRFQIFKNNLKTIKNHNERFEQGLIFYQLDINKFADITKDEFMQQLTLNQSKANQNILPPSPPIAGAIPEEFDWRLSGAVTEVKDQKECGSCWSFSATGSVEGQYFRKTGSLVSLSEQNLIDCSTQDDGCNGGWMTSAFDYIKDNGIHRESEYGFEATKKACKSIATENIKIKGHQKITQNDEESLKEAIAHIGPISAAMDASNLQLYSGGVYKDVECSKDNINHGVLVVGYGETNGRAYWLVKNSWGAKWGENGYFKIARNDNNHCGIATHGLYPVL